MFKESPLTNRDLTIITLESLANKKALFNATGDLVGRKSNIAIDSSIIINIFDKFKYHTYLDHQNWHLNVITWTRYLIILVYFLGENIALDVKKLKGARFDKRIRVGYILEVKDK